MSEKSERADHLARLRHWYDQDKNPLYAWEAIALCLRNDKPPTIPDWCLPYLRDAAFEILRLTRLSSDKEAMRLIGKALGLSRQGKRNAFADLIVDRNDARDALSAEFFGQSEIVEITVGQDGLSKTSWGRGAIMEIIAKRRAVSLARAKRRISRGNKLLRLPRRNLP